MALLSLLNKQIHALRVSPISEPPIRQLAKQKETRMSKSWSDIQRAQVEEAEEHVKKTWSDLCEPYSNPIHGCPLPIILLLTNSELGTSEKRAGQKRERRQRRKWERREEEKRRRGRTRKEEESELTKKAGRQMRPRTGGSKERRSPV